MVDEAGMQALRQCLPHDYVLLCSALASKDQRKPTNKSEKV